jgi:hypothetical protein
LYEKSHIIPRAGCSRRDSRFATREMAFPFSHAPNGICPYATTFCVINSHSVLRIEWNSCFIWPRLDRRADVDKRLSPYHTLTPTLTFEPVSTLDKINLQPTSTSRLADLIDGNRGSSTRIRNGRVSTTMRHGRMTPRGAHLLMSTSILEFYHSDEGAIDDL